MRALAFFICLAISIPAAASLGAQHNAGQTDRIIYAPVPDWSPIDYINFRGEHVGTLADFVAHIELVTGLEFDRFHLETWSDILDSLQTGAVDVTVGIHRTPSREAFLNFTEPFLTIPMVILVRDDSGFRYDSNIDDMRLAVVRNYASTEFLQNNFPNSIYLTVEDELTAMIHTAYGTTDGLMIDVFTANHFIQRYGISNLRLGPAIDFDWELRIGVVKSNPELFEILQAAVAELPADFDQSLLRSPFDFVLAEQPGVWATYQNSIISVALLVGLILIVILLLNYRLKKLVSEQVGEIEQQNAKLREIAWMQSHELRSPLCRMSTIIESLQDHEGCDDETRELISYLQQSADDMDNAIREIVRKTENLQLEEFRDTKKP